MKVPDEIETLFQLKQWVEKNKPKIILIGKKSLLMQIREFYLRGWDSYRGIPIKYEKAKNKNRT